MYLREYFALDDVAVADIQSRNPVFGYGLLSEFILYDKYSRLVDGKKEEWGDIVIRCINGMLTIRKDWYCKNNLTWDEVYWQEYGHQAAISMFNMCWLPPGRGLWAMGTSLLRTRGAMALYNCAFTEITPSWIDDYCWLMDSLMYGVGVGFGLPTGRIRLEEPSGEYHHMVDDSREGWVDSVGKLLFAYQGGAFPHFDYSAIRPAGSPLKTFGGTASGSDPLEELHHRLIETCELRLNREISTVRFALDVGNMIGCCVVAGNIRRGAQIALGSGSEFLSLKDYSRFPERAAYGWMSNNSVRLVENEDFHALGDLSTGIRRNGEPGYLNLRNVRKGRIGDTKYNLRQDLATGVNPCGEIPLEHREVCNLAETVPTRCANVDSWLRACEYATLYCSSVTLLATHQPTTNLVIARNRRIGVSLVDIMGWKEEIGTAPMISALRAGYNRVREVNSALAAEAGVPESIRVTTVKPGGTVPKLPGRASGMSRALFRYTLRRVRVSKGSAVAELMAAASVPNEPCLSQPLYTTIFEIPVYNRYDRIMGDVSVWEQAMDLVMLQREWADNAVSNTLTFKAAEAKDVEHVLAAIAPLTKSVAMLPESTGCYEQMPEEGITREEYERRVEAISPINWSLLNEDANDEADRFCSGAACSI